MIPVSQLTIGIDRDRAQRKRQVVVDVRIHAKQHVLQHQAGAGLCGVEAQPPRPGHIAQAPGVVLFERVTVEVRERDRIPVHPLSVGERPLVDPVAHLAGHNPVEREEDAPPILLVSKPGFQSAQSQNDIFERSKGGSWVT